VKVWQLKVDIDDPRGLLDVVGKTPLDVQLACLDTTMTRLEFDVKTAKARAEAWSMGDVEALRDLPYVDQEAACGEALMRDPRIKALADQTRADWMAAADQALEKNQTTLALRTMDRLLGPEGLLAQFRAKGYTVEGP
jgi:uncharacterized protein YbaP (TraB family)